MNYTKLIFIILWLVVFNNTAWAETFVAQIDQDSKVTRVIVVPDAYADTSEVWTHKLLGGTWKRTYIDGSVRGRYAGPGYYYNGVSDTFITTAVAFSYAIIGDSIIAQMAPIQGQLVYPISIATNLGVSGNTATQIAARIGSVSSGTTHVIIEGGTNDLLGLGSDALIVSGYTTMLDALTSKLKVILMGIPQVDEAIINPTYLTTLNNTKIAEVNATLTALCATYVNCVASTEAMTQSMSGLTIDGIHPTVAGDIVLSQRLVDTLNANP